MLKFKINFLMRIFKLLILFTIISSIYCINENKSDDDFIPSNEWQVVKPGQKIPPGLHIRSDLKTGITEAKILDKNETNNQNTAMSLSNVSNEEVNDTKQSYSPDQLKRMLKGIKDESPEGIEINGTKFRSYEELKKDFETMQISIKTDLEIIRELLNELKGDVDNVRTKTILVDLEYYLHQIDNAQNFVDMGGLVFLHRFMDSSEVDIRSEALRCLSSALQGNSKVKVEAMKSGTLSRLLLSLKSASDVATINQIYVAISAITRQFPIAQVAFINGRGLEISEDIFDRLSITGDEKINVRMVTMISDWFKERNMEELKKASTDIEREIAMEKELQYKKIDLSASLVSGGWCQRFMSLWSPRKDRAVDYVEKLIVSVNVIYPHLRQHFNHDSVIEFLTDARQSVASMASQDQDDFYFRDVLELITDTMTVVDSGTEQRHSEL